MENSANSFCRTIWPGKICIPKQVPSWFWCSTASNPLLPQGGASIVWQVLARFQGCTTFQSATGHRSTDVRLKKRACTASVLQECSRCCTRPVHKAKKKGTKFTFLFVRWAFVDKDRGKQTWHAQGNLFHLEAKLGWQCICSIMFDYVCLCSFSCCCQVQPWIEAVQIHRILHEVRNLMPQCLGYGPEGFQPLLTGGQKESMQHAFFATYTMDMHRIYHQSVVQDRCLNDIDSWDDFGFVMGMKINDCGTYAKSLKLTFVGNRDFVFYCPICTPQCVCMIVW